MGLIILIVYTVLLAVTITSALPIGWLLLLSVALILYSVFNYIFHTNELTAFNKWLVALSVIGFVYSVLVLVGIDLSYLF